MKALKSKLAEEILASGTNIPLKDGAKFNYNGKDYEVKVVPMASLISKNKSASTLHVKKVKI